MKSKLVIAGLVLGLLLLASPVAAQGAPSPLPASRAKLRTLAPASLKSCEARQEAVKTRMSSLLRMATNMMEKFDAIAQRVKEYYTNALVPSGKTLSNYDALVADIEAKKDIIKTDLAEAETHVNLFTCSGDDPKTHLTEFRAGMQKVKSDLKSFRTSIKNLIVAVRRLAPKATGTPEATTTPSPTPIPTATP